MFRTTDNFSNPDILILLGIGFLIGSVLCIVVMRLNLVEDLKLRRVIVIVGAVVGLLLVATGILLK